MTDTVPETWISAGGIFPLLWIFLATIAFTIALERSRIKRFIPGPVLIIIIPCALANFGVIPARAPEYAILSQFAVPMGVALLLLRADIAQILRASGSMLPLFFIGLAGSLTGLGVSALLFEFEREASLAAALVAYFTGSTVNVVATAQAIEMDATLLAAVIAASAVVIPSYLAIVMVLMRSEWIGVLVRAAPGSSRREGEPEGEAASQTEHPGPRPPLGVLVAALYALGLFILVDQSAALLGWQQYTILIATIFSILIPNLVPGIRKLVNGDRELGMLLMFLFICALAAQIDLGAMGFLSLWIMLFMTIALTINIAVLLIAGRLLKTDPHLLFLASLGGVGGPPSAAAVAAAQGREDLVTPSILCGLLGIVIGTFLGIFTYQIFA
jgi:uncharacterized membrane protein